MNSTALGAIRARTHSRPPASPSQRQLVALHEAAHATVAMANGAIIERAVIFDEAVEGRLGQVVFQVAPELGRLGTASIFAAGAVVEAAAIERPVRFTEEHAEDRARIADVISNTFLGHAVTQADRLLAKHFIALRSITTVLLRRGSIPGDIAHSLFSACQSARRIIEIDSGSLTHELGAWLRDPTYTPRHYLPCRSSANSAS